MSSPSTWDNALQKLLLQARSFRDTFSSKIEVCGDPVSGSLAGILGLSFTSPVVSWKPRSLKDNTFTDPEPQYDFLPRRYPSSDSSEIYTAYHGSRSTWNAIRYRAIELMFHGDKFPNYFTSAKPDFEHLDVYRVCSRMNLECQFVFASPSIPNVTIISIQPQQGPPGELVIIELWILLYWALRLAKRVNGYTSFPVRVVSICDTKARFLSANFSRGFVKRLERKPVGPDESVTADIEIGSYYEVSHEDEFLQFLKQLVDIPIPPPVYHAQSEQNHEDNV